MLTDKEIKDIRKSVEFPDKLDELSVVRFTEQAIQATESYLLSHSEPDEKLVDTIAEELCNHDYKNGECEYDWQDYLKLEDSGAREYYRESARLVLPHLFLIRQQAEEKERERIHALITEISHRHHGELCFTPIKESELWQALSGGGK